MKRCFIRIRGRQVDVDIKDSIVGIITDITGKPVACVENDRGGCTLFYAADKDTHDQIIRAVEDRNLGVNIGYSYPSRE